MSVSDTSEDPDRPIFIRSVEVQSGPSAIRAPLDAFPDSAAALRALITDHRQAPFEPNGKPILNDAQVQAQLFKTPEQLIWSGNSFTYAFPTAPWFAGGEADGFSALKSTQEGAAKHAMTVWDDVIVPDIAFNGTDVNSTIKFANTTTAIQYAHGYFPANSVKAGSIWLNGNADSKAGADDLITPKLGAWGFTTYIHEAGHALGLSHPGKYDASQGQFTYAGAAEYLQDSQMFTVMSYFKAFNTKADITAADGKEYIPQTPMMDDIMTMQGLYGAETTRAASTVYGFHSTLTGSVYDFNTNKHPFLCIVDSGGTDTIDVSGWSTPSLIDLSPGSFSDADTMTYNISIARGVVIENATTGNGADLVSGNSVDNVIRLNGGDDAAVGFLGNDTIYGGSGKDVLAGEDGNDTLDGGTDADRLIGGKNDDTYVVDSAADVIVEVAGEGTADRAKASASYVLAANASIELLTTDLSTGTTVINLTGNALKQEILGNAAANIIKDGPSGGAGDLLRGLAGNDTYQIFSSASKIQESSTHGSADKVIAAVDFALDAGVYVEVMQTVSAAATTGIDLTGNALKQDITGNAGANLLNSGGAGASDTLRGLGGSDTYRVHNTGDTIVEVAGQGTDKAITSISYALGTGVSVEVLQTNLSAGTSAINLYGNEIAQEIIGNNGANRIEGKGGADTLRGLGGADTFVFATKLGGGNTDTIVDFNPTNDRLQLSDTIFTALSPGTIAADQFRANTTGEARDSTDRIIYDTDSGGIFYDADGLGGAAGVRFAIVSTGLSITNADFHVV